MKLSPERLAQYDRDGFLRMPGVFSHAELDSLRIALAEDLTRVGPHRVTENDGVTVRAVYASHTRHPVFRDLTSCERLLGPAMQLVSQELYVHQFKVSAKQPFGGDGWAWHQDYPVWRDIDRMPAPRAVNVAVFLDDMTEFNGPVVFLRGSHRLGSDSSLRQDAVGAWTEWHFDPYVDSRISCIDPHGCALSTAELSTLAETYEMTSPKGTAGTVVFFHPEIVHGSAPNISPFPHNLLTMTYNACSNAPRPLGEPRPEYLVGRDTTPLVPRAERLESTLVAPAGQWYSCRAG